MLFNKNCLKVKSMPNIFVTGYYPTHKIAEVVKKFFETRKKFPPSEFPGELLVDATSTSTERGIETVEIYNTSEENFGKATKWLTKSLVPYQLIEGFEYTVRNYTTLEEGLESIGMKMPD